MSTGEISRIVLYNAISAAKEYKDRTGKAPVVSIVVDEAQNVVAANLEVVVEQARSHGVALVLCHHTREQLKKPGGDDLRHLVDSVLASNSFSQREVLKPKNTYLRFLVKSRTTRRLGNNSSIGFWMAKSP